MIVGDGSFNDLSIYGPDLIMTWKLARRFALAGILVAASLDFLAMVLLPFLWGRIGMDPLGPRAFELIQKYEVYIYPGALLKINPDRPFSSGVLVALQGIVVNGVLYACVGFIVGKVCSLRK